MTTIQTKLGMITVTPLSIDLVSGEDGAKYKLPFNAPVTLNPGLWDEKSLDHTALIVWFKNHAMGWERIEVDLEESAFVPVKAVRIWETILRPEPKQQDRPKE